MGFFDQIFGGDSPLPIRFAAAFIVVLAFIGLAAWVLKRITGARLLKGVSGGRARQPRLGVLDVQAVDSRRRLVLIRRDNVEHLIMLGGPNDIVIESGIVRHQQQRDTSRAPAPARRAEAPATPSATAPTGTPPAVPPRPVATSAARPLATPTARPAASDAPRTQPAAPASAATPRPPMPAAASSPFAAPPAAAASRPPLAPRPAPTAMPAERTQEKPAAAPPAKPTQAQPSVTPPPAVAQTPAPSNPPQPAPAPHSMVDDDPLFSDLASKLDESVGRPHPAQPSKAPVTAPEPASQARPDATAPAPFAPAAFSRPSAGPAARVFSPPASKPAEPDDKNDLTQPPPPPERSATPEQPAPAPQPKAETTKSPLDALEEEMANLLGRGPDRAKS